MCEIFYAHARNGTLNEQTIRELCNAALEAASRNSDGFGVFNEDRTIYKQPNKFDEQHVDKIVDMYNDSKFIVMHLRLQTDGSVCTDNTHPFTEGEQLLCHNGIVSVDLPDERKNSDETDSKRMLKAIVDNNNDNTVTRIRESLEEKVNGGVSVFYIDENDELYYYRDGKPFTFAYIQETDEFVGASKKKRFKHIYTDQYELQESTPRKGKIYRITEINEDIADQAIDDPAPIGELGITAVAEFETRGTTRRASTGYYGSYGGTTVSGSKGTARGGYVPRGAEQDDNEQPTTESYEPSEEKYEKQWEDYERREWNKRLEHGRINEHGEYVGADFQEYKDWEEYKEQMQEAREWTEEKTETSYKETEETWTEEDAEQELRNHAEHIENETTETLYNRHM